ncbi:hypothetical protein XELAEV_18041101mg, partial [Xenopus laevis]
LDDAIAQQNSGNAQQSQGQDPGQPQQQPWPWGNPPPAQYPGYPGAPPGQYPGYPGAQGQQYPGSFPGQQYPGFPAPGQGQPGFPAPGQGHPGFPAPGQGHPGFPAPGQGHPGFPAPGQGHPGFPAPGHGHPGFPAPGHGHPGFPAQDPHKPGFPGQPEPPKPSAPVQLKVPFDLPLPSGVVPRLKITVNGKINPNPKRFVVDLKKGQDIALHINPRFHERPHVIVRNSMINTKWGPEERQAPKFPFAAGQPFKIQVHCEADHYKVAVNNEILFQYSHRVRELHEIKNVHVYGDITLTDVNYTMG